MYNQRACPLNSSIVQPQTLFIELPDLLPSKVFENIARFHEKYNYLPTTIRITTPRYIHIPSGPDDLTSLTPMLTRIYKTENPQAVALNNGDEKRSIMFKFNTRFEYPTQN
jgi:hypothetical protein